MISEILLQRDPTGTGSWTTIQAAEYSYYTGYIGTSTTRDPNGRLGDLKYVQIWDYQKNPSSPQLLSQKYYRYDKLSTVQFSSTDPSFSGFDTRGPTNDPATTGGVADSSDTSADGGDNYETGDNAVVSGLRSVVEGTQCDELFSAYGSLSSVETQSDATIQSFAQKK